MIQKYSLMFEVLQQQGVVYLIGVILVFVTLIWSLNRLQRSLPSPVNKLIVRWIRLVIIAGFAAIIFKFTFFGGVAYWRLFIMGFLAWIFIDSGYLWLYILAWDKSELPLFPSVREVERVDWPANTRFFLIKDWIRENNYQEIGCFHYLYEDEILQQLVVFESPDRTVRLQVIIVTDVTGVILDQIVFSSITDSGQVIITDNVFMPYGGVYPENWNVSRYPAIRKIQKIAQNHSASIVADGKLCCVKYEDEAKVWIQDMQNDLERENVLAGILNDRRDRNEYGKMTGEGRYRIWKELLLLNYFSISMIQR